MDIGVLYIAVGKEFVDMALDSAKSVKHFCPDLHIHLFSDRKIINNPCIDTCEIIDDGHRRSKVDYISRSPFQRTLFLDADTKVVNCILPLFQLLDDFDIGLTHAHLRYSYQTNRSWNESIPYSFPQLNSGVILFKNSSNAIDLLLDWKTQFHLQTFKKDQVTLRELIWKSNARLIILPNEFNNRFKKYEYFWEESNSKPRIMHYNEYRYKYGAIDVVSQKLSKHITLSSFVSKTKWIMTELPSWKDKLI